MTRSVAAGMTDLPDRFRSLLNSSGAEIHPVRQPLLELVANDINVIEVGHVTSIKPLGALNVYMLKITPNEEKFLCM